MVARAAFESLRPHGAVTSASSKGMSEQKALPDLELVKGPFVPGEVVYRSRGGFVIASMDPNFRLYLACPYEHDGKWFWGRKQAANYVDNHGIIQS